MFTQSLTLNTPLNQNAQLRQPSPVQTAFMKKEIQDSFVRFGNQQPVDKVSQTKPSGMLINKVKSQIEKKQYQAALALLDQHPELLYTSLTEYDQIPWAYAARFDPWEKSFSDEQYAEAKRNKFSFLEVLAEKMTDLSQQQDQWPHLIFNARNFPESFSILQKHGVSLETSIRGGRTVLQHTSAEASDDAVKALLQLGVDHRGNTKSFGPLVMHLTHGRPNYPVSVLLFEQLSSTEIQAQFRELIQTTSPLSLALYDGDLEKAKMLLQEYIKRDEQPNPELDAKYASRAQRKRFETYYKDFKGVFLQTVLAFLNLDNEDLSDSQLRLWKLDGVFAEPERLTRLLSNAIETRKATHPSKAIPSFIRALLQIHQDDAWLEQDKAWLQQDKARLEPDEAAKRKQALEKRKNILYVRETALASIPLKQVRAAFKPILSPLVFQLMTGDYPAALKTLQQKSMTAHMMQATFRMYVHPFTRALLEGDKATALKLVNATEHSKVQFDGLYGLMGTGA